MALVWDALYLGVLPLIDPAPNWSNDEYDNQANDAWRLVGQSFGDAANPLRDNLVEVTPQDNGGTQGVLDMDGAVGSQDGFTWQAPGGPLNSSTFDATATYFATITFQDGTTETVTAVIFQDTQGNTFIAPEYEQNTDVVSYLSGPIETITLNQLESSTYNGMYIDRVDGSVCFAKGTMIDTPEGERPIETLGPGDLVLTDEGPQPVLWISASLHSAYALGTRPSLIPVRIAPGALGAGCPEKPLVVSQQHRVLVRSRIAERMFAAAEVLVAAKHLLELEGITLADDLPEVTYFHMMFETHRIVRSNGAETESFFPGPMALKTLSPKALTSLYRAFPELEQDTAYPPARPFVSGREGRQLAFRHGKNGKPLIAA